MGWSFSVGTFVSALAWSQGWEDKVLISYDTFVGCWLVLCAAADLVISLTLYLAIRKNVLGFNKFTDHRVITIIKTSVLTASYTSGKSKDEQMETAAAEWQTC